MRILHTADWHLGRIFQGIHLTNDQVYVLDQIKTIARESDIDIIVITGDIYDRAVPPPEAVKLLDDTLSFFISDIKIPVIMIAGNHDSPDRLNFGSRLFASHGLYLIGILQLPLQPLILSDKHGQVHFYALPYAEPSFVREISGNQEVKEHNDAMASIINSIVKDTNSVRQVMCGHSFITGGTTEESERPLSIGGTGSVDYSHFRRFTCSLLGHLHRPQWVLNSSIHYSGSILPYSFSEINHKKSITLIEIDAVGNLSYEYVPLTPLHAVRCIEGTLSQIINDASQDPHKYDYLLIRLHDREPILDAIGKLRNVYPNVLHLEKPGIESLISEEYLNKIDHRKLSDEDLFSAFFSQTTGLELSSEQAEFFFSIIQKVHRKEREA